jgi:hypothetical protein
MAIDSIPSSTALKLPNGIRAVSMASFKVEVDSGITLSINYTSLKTKNALEGLRL